MATIQQIPTFQAVWNSQNQHLMRRPDTLLLKVAKVGWNVISVLIPVILIARMIGWGVARLSKMATLPSAVHYLPQDLQRVRDIFNTYCFGPINRENRPFRTAYTVERHSIATPDGATLAALHFKHRQSGSDTPTVLYFQPNLALSEHFIHSWLLSEAIRRNLPVNFVAFDYRGVSLSHGDLKNPKQLIIDGDSMYQFVRDKLQVPPSLNRGYSWSLGGVVSANVKAIHPEWDSPYVNERSLSSTAETVGAWLTGILKVVLFWFPYAMERTKWNLVSPIESVRGPVMIVYHPKDTTIPYDASCHARAIRNQLTFESVRLRGNSQLRLAEMLRFHIYHHAHPLRDYVVQERENLPADQVIADFIFSQTRAAQEQTAAAS